MKNLMNNQAINPTGAQKSSAFGNSYLFTGRRLDEKAGVYYYRNRYYNPNSGRFLHRDILGYFDALNLYHYTLNNPVSMTDPLGTSSVETQFAVYYNGIFYREELGAVKVAADFTCSSEDNVEANVNPRIVEPSKGPKQGIRAPVPIICENGKRGFKVEVHFEVYYEPKSWFDRVLKQGQDGGFIGLALYPFLGKGATAGATVGGGLSGLAVRAYDYHSFGVEADVTYQVCCCCNNLKGADKKSYLMVSQYKAIPIVTGKSLNNWASLGVFQDVSQPKCGWGFIDMHQGPSNLPPSWHIRDNGISNPNLNGVIWSYFRK